MIKYIYQNKSKGINMEDELIFSMKWFSLDKYYFKILTIITELADNTRTFKGTLSAFCENPKYPLPTLLHPIFSCHYLLNLFPCWHGIYNHIFMIWTILCTKCCTL